MYQTLGIYNGEFFSFSQHVTGQIGCCRHPICAEMGQVARAATHFTGLRTEFRMVRLRWDAKRLIKTGYKDFTLVKYRSVSLGVLSAGAIGASASLTSSAATDA